MAHSLLAAAQLRWMAALGERRLDGSGRWPLVTTPRGNALVGALIHFFLRRTCGLEGHSAAVTLCEVGTFWPAASCLCSHPISWVRAERSCAEPDDAL